MKHFSPERWADYSRGVAGETERIEMERHLQAGCGECERLLGMLKSVSQAASRNVEVPAAVTASARAIFKPAAKPAPKTEGSIWRKLTAALVFDSAMAPALEGVRGAGAMVRQLTYRAEDFEIQIIADPNIGGNYGAITGQITVGGAAAPQSPLAVALATGKKIVQQTGSNEFGEFQLESPRRSGLRLLIRDERLRREIEIPLEFLLGAAKATKRSRRT